MRVNVAVTLRASVMLSVHVGDEPLHAPDQPVKLEKGSAVAESVTVVLCP
jgi:hypothetical protein